MISLRDIELKTEAFRQFMDEIDRRLLEQGVPIPGRPIAAFRELAKEGIFLPIVSALDSPGSDNIHDWFRRRYGDRLLLDPCIGKIVISVRGDPYILKLPLIYGSWGGPLDVEKTFDGMTKYLFADLSDEIRHDMISMFVWSYRRFLKLEGLPGSQRANLDAAIMQLTSHSPHYGESKWASLQFAEKSLKKFIEARGEKAPFTHDLEKLLSHAEGLGLAAGCWPLTKMIQCPASVRYDNAVSLYEAMIAHHASIDLCADISEQLKDGSAEDREHLGVNKVVASFSYTVATNEDGGLLFKFVLNDGSESLLLFSGSACASLIELIDMSKTAGRHADDRQAYSSRIKSGNIPPRHPIRVFLSTVPDIQEEDFHGDVKVVASINKFSDYNNAVIIEIGEQSGGIKEIILASELVNYFLDSLQTGIEAGKERGFFSQV